MRRFLMLLCCLMLMACVLVMPASAENMATKVESIINVTPAGDCIVSTTVRLNLDSRELVIGGMDPLQNIDVLIVHPVCSFLVRLIYSILSIYDTTNWLAIARQCKKILFFRGVTF